MDWPHLRNSLCAQDVSDVNPYLVTLTAGSSNVKGDWVEVAAALAHSVSGIIIEYKPGAANYALIDIGIGAAAAEVVVIPNISGMAGQSDTASSALFFPLSIPAGTRVACRYQNLTGAATIGVKLHFITASLAGIQGVQRWADWGTVQSSGKTVVAGGTAHTKGSYVQLVAATEFTTSWLMLMFRWLDTNRNFAIDIAVGAAASEQIIIPNFYSFVGNAFNLLIPFTIPAGSRIAARCASQNAFSSVDISILGGA